MNARTSAIPESETRTSAAPAQPRRSRFRRVLPLIALLVLAGGAAGGTWYWQVGRFMESTDNAHVGGDIAVLSSRIEGDVVRILVADNQPVEAGQPLIELDRQDWQARRDQAAAALAEAEANIGTLAAQIGQARAQVASAEAQIAEAEAERVRAVADAGRAGTLAQGGYGTREAVDRTVANRRKAEAALTAAQAGLESARGAIPVLEAQSRSASARRDAARAALALAESDLDHTVIRAPYAGIAGNRAAQLGQHVRAGQNLIAVSPTADRLYVTANFKETQLRRIREGQPVELSVDAGGTLHGVVQSLAPATGAQFSLLPPENATGNFTKIVQRVPVRIAVDPGQAVAHLRPGLSVEAEVDTRDDPHGPRSLFGAAAAMIRGR
ncbi:membrane fusion protein, multidrug efflux system [Roseomonas rosea]|uniref:Membrane fusion protein, multidrug efflux system n=1 Tax=Muricoccus roseus TaxID=198092 RepID=A0A1M6KE65_9PROT|nr:HlyD family secretion protein [Roseomonas rosea]SHJ57241.1 membrane fusion protein, multidrug efflux system [Roseomonas rosea]